VIREMREGWEGVGKSQIKSKEEDAEGRQEK